MRYKILWIIILLLFAGDMATTLYGLENGHSEANPVVADAIEQHGAVTALLLLMPIKIGAMLAGLAGQWFAGWYGEPHRQKWFPLMVLFILALPPVAWNLYVLA